MSGKIQKAFENLMPFIMLGVAIAIVIGLVFMFFYIALWGFVIGAVLWLITLIRQYFFPTSVTIKENGRIIEHDNKK